MSAASPVDIHDPREHFRKLIVDVQNSLLDHIRALGEALDGMHHSKTAEDRRDQGIEAAKATQGFAMFVATAMQESNRLGYAEGREERDVSEAVFRGALEFLLPAPDYSQVSPEARAQMRQYAIKEARYLWDDVRRSVLAAQEIVRAKQRAEAEALVSRIMEPEKSETR